MSWARDTMDSDCALRHPFRRVGVLLLRHEIWTAWMIFLGPLVTKSSDDSESRTNFSKEVQPKQKYWDSDAELCTTGGPQAVYGNDFPIHFLVALDHASVLRVVTPVCGESYYLNQIVQMVVSIC